MRLLVAEDEDLLRARLVKALEDNSYVVDSCSNGKTALFQAVNMVTTPPSSTSGCPALMEFR